MNVAYLCLGGNLGDRTANLNEAIRLISREIAVPSAVSGLYETKAWGIDHAPDYLNLCLKLDTTLEAPVLLEKLLTIEQQLGRVRQAEERNASRTVDIDLLFFNAAILQLPQLELPHPRLHLRRFVLVPLCEIAADYVHPVLNQTVKTLLENCPDELMVKPYRP